MFRKGRSEPTGEQALTMDRCSYAAGARALSSPLVFSAPSKVATLLYRSYSRLFQAVIHFVSLNHQTSKFARPKSGRLESE